LPDAYHLGTSYGVSEFDRPVNSFDTVALYAGVSWHPGDITRHKESLEATRRLEIATVTGHIQPLPVQSEAGSTEDDEHWPIPPPPGDRDEAINLVLYGAFLLLAGFAILLGAIGVVKWRKKNGTTPQGDDR